MSDEVSTTKRSRVFPRLVIFLVVVALGALIATVAFAGWTTISMTNGTIDTAAWGTATYTDPTGDANPANPRDDMVAAWFKFDGNNIYFRIQTASANALSSSSRRAVGLIDCNRDGDFTDPYTAQDTTAGDRIIIYNPGPTGQGVYIRDGQFQQVTGALSGDNFDAPAGADIEWQVPISFLPPACRGTGNYVNIKWVIGTDTGAQVDDSSQYFALNNPMDYGDANNPTPATGNCATPSANNPQTLLICNGARNGILPYQTPGVPLQLGAEPVDGDAGNLQNANFDADDTNGTTPDDEAGIAPDPAVAWKVGAPPSFGGKLVFTVSGGAARLVCVVDFNKDGRWDTATETVLNTNVSEGANQSRTFTIPNGVTIANNSLPARCRVYPQPTGGGATPTPAVNGPIEFGEVEDHIWQFDANGFYQAPCVAPGAPTGLTISKTDPTTIGLNWSAVANATKYEVWTAENAPYFDPGARTCAGPAPYQCSTVTTTSYSATDLGDPAVNHSYMVRSGNNCGLLSAMSTRAGEWDFTLQPGLP